MSVMAPKQTPLPPGFHWAGYALGFGLGGFFDGILLHQVLQWHHLLSGIEEARQDIRLLILTDGLFHLLMYVVVAFGLYLLWRTRGQFYRPLADRVLFAAALIGFGVWHVVDGVLSHWVLGIHRIRMDVNNPLLWDLLWLAVFGLVPLIAGIMLRRRTGPSTPSAVTSAPLALALAVAISGPWAALPAPVDTTTMVLFRPGMEPTEAFAALRSLDAILVWTDPSQQLWAVDLPAGAERNQLYGLGAMLVSNSIVPAGCFDWLRS